VSDRPYDPFPNGEAVIRAQLGVLVQARENTKYLAVNRRKDAEDSAAAAIKLEGELVAMDDAIARISSLLPKEE